MVYSFLKRCLKGRKGTQSHINTLFSNLFNADLLRNLFQYWKTIRMTSAEVEQKWLINNGCNIRPHL
jgi:hypothetical protein